MLGTCRNCRKEKSLRRSHAIPNGFFKPLARGSRGQFIEITDGPSDARTSQDSGREFLLCDTCERIFDEQFDRPIIDEVRRIRSALTKGVNQIESDVERVKSGLASIIWRASESEARIYESYKLSQKIRNELFEEMYNSNSLGRLFSYGIQPIFDAKDNDGRIYNEIIEKFIVTPKLWNINHGFGGRLKKGWGTIFVMGGVVVTICQPRLSPYKERALHYLPSNRQNYQLRPVDMWSIPYLKEFLVQAVQKEKRSNRSPHQSPSSS